MDFENKYAEIFHETKKQTNNVNGTQYDYVANSQWCGLYSDGTNKKKKAT